MDKDIDIVFTFFIYFSVLILGSFFAYAVEHSNKKDWEIIFRIWLFFVLLFPSIFRYGIGHDYMEYKRIYDSDLFWDYAEFGFCVICQILKFFECSSFWMFFWIAFLTYSILCFILPKDNFFIFIFFYIAFYGYFYSLDGMRQALALPFAILSFYAYEKKSYWKSILWLICAIMFHYSSIVFLVLFPFMNIKLNKKTSIVLTFLLSLLFIKLDYIRIIETLSKISDMRYLLLLNNSLGVTSSLGLGLILKIFYPLCFILTVNKNNGVRTKKETLSVNYCILYIVLSFLVLKIDIFNRLRDVVWAGVLFSVTAIPKSRYRKLITLFILFSGILLYWVYIGISIGPNTKMLTPYISIFD